MKLCARCLYPNTHPLGLTLDEATVCSGCRIHEEKDSLDWRLRWERLKHIVDGYRSNSNRYDCIVPVSGGRDSYFIVDTVKKRLGLNPLLVSYNRHYNTERGHRNFAYIKTLFDCDALQMVVQPQKVKRIVRETLRLRGSFHWHAIAGQTVYPVQVAVRFRIPLIIWGHHQGLDQVGMHSHLDEVEMSRRYRMDHDLMGLEAEDLLQSSPKLTEMDVLPYVYPDSVEIAKVGVRGIYLGNYIRWDSKTQHEQMIQQYAYETGAQLRTFDPYEDPDDSLYASVHDEIKFAKHGYGKALDHACREIRFGRMTREEGSRLAALFSSKSAAASHGKLLSWLGMSAEEWQSHLAPFVKYPREGILQLAEPPNARQIEQAKLPARPSTAFQVTESRNPAADESEFKLLHKGFVRGRSSKPREARA